MGHEIAKLLLDHAGTFLERAEAIETALSLGMPLHEIEEYLDWLDMARGSRRKDSEGPEEEDLQGPHEEHPPKK
jgi:DNA-binding transcriptional MerR regulator